MKAIVTSLFLVGLAATGASFFSSSAYAQTSVSFDDLTPANGWQCNTDKSSCTNQNGATASCKITGGSLETGSFDTTATCTVINPDGTGSTNSNTSAPGTTITTDNTTNAQGQVTHTSSSVDTASGGSWGDFLLKAVATAVLGFANFLLGIAGVLFNLVMFYGVFQFANTVGNSPGVLTAWGILRDLANMALLFGFIFMGIATILDTGVVQNFTAKRALPSLLIFAILMNFSLFTAEAVIDVSNALSATMYTQANTDPCIGHVNDGTLTTQNCSINYGLAGHIMQSTGLAGIWAVKGNSLAADATTYFGLALFATVGAIVFFAAAIMLAIRVVVLTLLMVVSPIGFAGMAIPPLRNLAGNWWQRVIHQAFYAPIMLLLILISLKIADSFTSGAGAGVNNGLANSSLAAAVINQDTSVMGVFLVFMLVIGFMVASLIVANRFGAAGASFAVNATSGTLGLVGRRTVGRVSEQAGKSLRSSAWAQRNPGLARRTAAVLDKGATSSFDLRASKAIGKAAKKTGFELNKPGKNAAKGYRGTMEASVKTREEFAKSLKPTKEQGTGAKEELQHELDALNTAQEEYLKTYFEEIEEKRKIVEEARKKGDEDTLRTARDNFKGAIKQYDDAKRSKNNPFNEGAEFDENGFVKKKGKKGRGDDLQKQIKAWDNISNAQKTNIVVRGLENSGAPLTLGRQANLEAAEKIKKGKPKGVEGALASLKDEIDKNKKDEGEGGEEGHGEEGKSSGTTDSSSGPMPSTPTGGDESHH